MCGITACVGRDDALDDLLTGLKNLEYRGYDSSGVALRDGGELTVLKREGEISQLESALTTQTPTGPIGIGHTRWSTHGPPNDANAHPHTDCTGSVAVVHNGIIENYEELRRGLIDRGHRFTSETDTEVVPHLLEEHLADGRTPEEAFRRTVDSLEGSFALVMISTQNDTLYASRRGSPLVLGLSPDRFYLASDIPSFIEFTDRVVYLDDGDVISVAPDGYRITDADGGDVERIVESVNWAAEDAERGGYDHFMLKEIHEQPSALEQTLHGRLAPDDDFHLDAFSDGAFDSVDNVQLVACGTSYHAALYARQLLNDRGVFAQAFTAGEYATNPPPVNDGTLVVGVTQSGETADTLSSLRAADRSGARTLTVTNVVGSTAARESDETVFIRAGPEIGVAATKTFSSQVVTLLLLVERIARDATGRRSAEMANVVRALERLPGDMQRLLHESRSSRISERFRNRDAYFFIGRGLVYPVALEGALKFKEITYEHAEGFAAGELKHGPLALVTPDTPVFAIFSGRQDGKTLNNVKEVQARGAPVIGVTNERSSQVIDCVDEALTYPDTHPEVAGILANVHLQLVSYHVADLLGRSIDKPRNLAKSVTVE